jgi:preprotein translocase subunit SecG
VLTVVLVVIQVLVSVLLIALILLHTGKDSGMMSGSGFSFASQASVMERNLTRYTVATGIVFLITTFALGWVLA